MNLNYTSGAQQWISEAINLLKRSGVLIKENKET